MGEKSLQVALVEDNHAVEEFSAATSHPTLVHAVLPGASDRSAKRHNSHSANCSRHFQSVFGIVVQHKESRDFGKGKGISELLRPPPTDRVPRYVEVQDTPAIVGNNKEAVQKAKGHRAHGEENPWRRCLPGGYAETFASADPVCLDARFIQRGTVRSETSKPRKSSSPWTRGAPLLGVLRHHLENQFSYVLRDSFSARWLSHIREHGPVPAEASRMPAHHGLRTDQNEGLLPARPQAAGQQPEELVRCTWSGRGCLRFSALSCWRSARFSTRSAR